MVVLLDEYGTKGETDEEAVTQPVGYFVLEVVDLSARFNV